MADQDNKIEVRIVFNGRVQGVGFRYTAKRHAEWLGVNGTISNRPDGSVEMYAQGEQEKVEALVEALKGEPEPIRIMTVESFEITPFRAYSNFKII